MLGNQANTVCAENRMACPSKLHRQGKSGTFKTASCERVKNEVAGRGHGVAGIQYAQDAHTANAKD